MLKIAHVVEAFGGGVIDFIYLLCKYQPQNDHVIIHSPREDDIRVKFPPNAHFQLWEHAGREISILKDIKSAKYLKDILNANSFDVVHLHSSKAGAIGRLIMPFVSKEKRQRVIFTANGASFERRDISGQVRLIYKLIEYFCSRISGTVISVSKSECKTFKNIGIAGFYINNGIEISDKVRGIKNPGFTIMTVGRISAQKNPILFNSIAEEFVDYPNIHFIWIGDGEMRNKLTSKNIEVTGWKHKSEVLKAMARGHIYLSTSLWEGLPFSVLDAMDLELPLVLNDCTGNRDLVIENSNGSVYRNKKTAVKVIKSLFEDERKRISQGIKSKKLLKERFNVVMMAKEYQRAYTGNFKSLHSI